MELNGDENTGNGKHGERDERPPCPRVDEGVLKTVMIDLNEPYREGPPAVILWLLPRIDRQPQEGP